MQKERRSPTNREDSEFFENGSPQPHGAPRGLLHFYALLSIARKPMRGYDMMKEIEIKTERSLAPGSRRSISCAQKTGEAGLHQGQEGKRRSNPSSLRDNTRRAREHCQCKEDDEIINGTLEPYESTIHRSDGTRRPSKIRPQLLGTKYRARPHARRIRQKQPERPGQTVHPSPVQAQSGEGTD